VSDLLKAERVAVSGKFFTKLFRHGGAGEEGLPNLRRILVAAGVTSLALVCVFTQARLGVYF